MSFRWAHSRTRWFDQAAAWYVNRLFNIISLFIIWVWISLNVCLLVEDVHQTSRYSLMSAKSLRKFIYWRKSMGPILFGRIMELCHILHKFVISKSFICLLPHTRALSNTADISSGATTSTFVRFIKSGRTFLKAFTWSDSSIIFLPSRSSWFRHAWFDSLASHTVNSLSICQIFYRCLQRHVFYGCRQNVIHHE